MKQTIRIRTAKFLITQGLIIVGIMVSFLWLSCVFFVKNASHWHLATIEGELKLFAEQASRSGEVPKRGDLGAYSFFIVSVEGKYILPRLPRSDESEIYWREYESKILYEMQKRRDGWSYYPERGRWDYKSGQYMLRYVYIPTQGWIVAAEGYMPSTLVLLQEMLTPALFWGMGFISLAAFVFMLLNANWHFHRVVRAIMRSQENNFIAVEGITSTQKTPGNSFTKQEERLPIAGDTTPFNPLARPQTASAGRPTLQPPADVYETEMPSTGRTNRHATQVEQSLAVNKERPVYQAPEPPPKPRPIEPQRQEPRGRKDLGNVVIDTTDIRSPILRKAIEELRENRE